MASNEVMMVAIHNQVNCALRFRQVSFVSMLFAHKNTSHFIIKSIHRSAENNDVYLLADITFIRAHPSTCNTAWKIFRKKCKYKCSSW